MGKYLKRHFLFVVKYDKIEEFNKEMTELNQLSDLAQKLDSFEEFEHEYQYQIRHGQYWHVTDDPNFSIHSSKGPRDMSSMSEGSVSPGKLMITSDLEHWHSYYNFDEDEKYTGKRPYAAEIDMSGVPLKEWYQVRRGFGNEFMVLDSSKARVIRVLPIDEALKVSEDYYTQIPQSREELKKFWEKNHINSRPDDISDFDQGYQMDEPFISALVPVLVHDNDAFNGIMSISSNLESEASKIVDFMKEQYPDVDFGYRIDPDFGKIFITYCEWCAKKYQGEIQNTIVKNHAIPSSGTICPSCTKKQDAEIEELELW